MVKAACPDIAMQHKNLVFRVASFTVLCTVSVGTFVCQVLPEFGKVGFLKMVRL
jgi:hypothetical protein